jgi:adenylate kinase family enzyme
MIQKIPKRIAIIGLPGSGKSTFATQLGKILNIPVHHLDKHVFDGRKKRNREEFLSVKEALVKEESWIIEGCSTSTFEMRFARADTVIYFQFSRLLCIWRLCKRILVCDKNLAESGCLIGINWPLIKYLWTFDHNQKQNIAELKKRYSQVNFILFSRPKDPKNFLDKLKRENIV